LTYKTQIPKQEYKDWAIENLKAEEIHIAHEIGKSDDECPYPHSHIIIEWNKRFQTTDQRKFDYKGIHPNIKPIVSREQLEHTYIYLAKEDPETKYLLEKQSSSFSKRVWSCKTRQEALSQIEKPGDVIGTLAMFDAKPKDPIKPQLITTFRPWQEAFMIEIAEEPDDRHIIWIYDPIGASGKSRLSRHIEDSDMGICITGTIRMPDVALVLKQELETKSTLPLIMVDLTRAFKDREIYNLLECIKNGRMMSGKYVSTRLRWNPGHVCVFANFLPEKGRCTEDRWIIHQISGDPEKDYETT